MQSSQRRDGVFTFNMHNNQLLSTIVDNEWRKDSFKNINIYIPENAKQQAQTEQNEMHEQFYKFPLEKQKEWNENEIYQLLGKFCDIQEIESKNKVSRY